MGVAETTVWFANPVQKWNDKWATFQRYVKVDYDTPAGYDFDTTNWTFGVRYWYTPNLQFELLYDDIDYGDDLAGFGYEDDNLIRLRTHVWF
jgi:hypothetical protein